MAVAARDSSCSFLEKSHDFIIHQFCQVFFLDRGSSVPQSGIQILKGNFWGSDILFNNSRKKILVHSVEQVLSGYVIFGVPNLNIYVKSQVNIALPCYQQLTCTDYLLPTK